MFSVSLFFSRSGALIKVPGNFPYIRVSQIADGASPAGSFRVVTSSGICGMKDGSPEIGAGAECRADGNCSLYVSLDGPDSFLGRLLFSISALPATAAVMYSAFRFLKFAAAVRVMLTLIMISAYIAVELCLNAEQANVIFFKSYRQLLPDTALRNICLILLMFLLSELAFDDCFISSSISRLALLGMVVYAAADWGVSCSFGVRADVSNISRIPVQS